jgi:hypothetical protein
VRFFRASHQEATARSYLPRFVAEATTTENLLPTSSYLATPVDCVACTKDSLRRVSYITKARARTT